MIDQGEVWAIEAGRQHLFRQRHADGHGHALAEGPGGGFHPGEFAVFRVPCRRGVELAEVFQIFRAHLVAREMQEAIKQHRGMAVREHKAIPVEPAGNLWVML